MKNSGPMPLPLQLEELTSEWLTSAVRTRAPGATVTGSEIVDVVNGTCTKVRIRLERDAAARDAGIPELVMLKGGFETHSRHMSHVHLSEVRGYRDVFPQLGLPVPQCYFAGYEDDAEQGIVIMEDLVERRVQFCSALVPQDFDTVARRLKVLARFHAKTWTDRDSLAAGHWGFLPESLPGLRIYMDQYLTIPAEWDRFIASPRGAATSVHFHDLDRIVRGFDSLADYSRRRPHCVVHGDTHLNNLFVYPDGTPGFFDGLPGRGSGLGEVAYHMTCALDLGDRRRWERGLVQHYLEELERGGVAAPSLDEAMREIGAYLLAGFIIFIVNESFYQSEAVNTAYAARFSVAMQDHGTLELLEGRPAI